MQKYDNNKLFYKQNGFCVVRSFLKPAELKNIDQKVKKFILEKSNKLKGKNINFTKNNVPNTIHDIDKFEKFFQKFAKNKKNMKIAKFFLDSEPEFRKCEIFAKPAKVGLASPMHQDNFLFAVKNNNALTFWISLDKSNKKNGGLSYIAGSHKLGILKHENSFMPGTSQKISKDVLKNKCHKLKKITPVLNPGDMLIHHCMVAHGSNVNKSARSRRGLTIQYKDKKSSYDLKRKKHYEKNLTKQLKARNQL